TSWGYRDEPSATPTWRAPWRTGRQGDPNVRVARATGADRAPRGPNGPIVTPRTRPPQRPWSVAPPAASFGRIGLLLGPRAVRLGLAFLRLDDLVVAADLEVLQVADDPRRPLDHDVLDPARRADPHEHPRVVRGLHAVAPLALAVDRPLAGCFLELVLDGDLELRADGVAVAPGALQGGPEPVGLRLG